MLSGRTGLTLVRRMSKSVLRCRLLSAILLISIFVLALARWEPSAAREIASTAVTSVSAASFETVAVAPDSIVAAFGAQLATQTQNASDTDPNTPGIQLPVQLGGTTVEVNGRQAGLFFVSPGQVNFATPPETELGAANVVIRASDGTTSHGNVEITRVTPAIFTANSNGSGVPAAALLRVKADGTQLFEPVFQFSQAVGRFIPKPIDLGPEGEQVFLVLFLSGIRRADDPNGDGNLNENFRVLIGGEELTPQFAGPQPAFVALDQINVQIPRSLIGGGIVNASIIASGFSSSNLVEIEIAGAPGSSPPQVSGFGDPPALAGNTLIINGSGFSPNLIDNLVRIGGHDAEVIEVFADRIKVLVPFGVESGTVSVRTPQGEDVSDNVLPVRTSISGLVENTSRQPMSGVTVNLSGLSITTTTNAEGSFVLPDVPTGVHFVEIDAGSLQTDPPFPKVILKVPALPNRDNQFSRPIALQQATGSGGSIGSGSSLAAVSFQQAMTSASQTQAITIKTDDFQLEIPATVSATFPGGARSGTIFLTPLLNARTPVELPFGFFSSSIAQITPFNVRLEPGGRLVFPNTDGLPPGAPAVLFRYDPDQGKFVREPETATVSNDGQRIETAPGAIKVTSYYFASALQQTTTITGRVLQNDGKTPAAKALVRFRGQEAYTDGKGSFILRFVPVRAGESVFVEVSFQRSILRVDRAVSEKVPAVIGGITRVPDVILQADKGNRPPTILAPAKLEIEGGKVTEIRISVTDPDPLQTVDVKVEGAPFATVVRGLLTTLSSYVLRLSPSLMDAGQFKLVLTATDSEGLSSKQEIALIVNRTPIANDQSVTLDEDTPINIKLNVTDPDGDPLLYTIVSPPTNGKLSGIVPALTYQPSPNFNGQDRFTFKAGDRTTESRVAAVDLIVRQVNDTPVLTVPGAQTVTETSQLTFEMSASDIDAGQTLTFSPVSVLPTGAALRQVTAVSSQFSWTPNNTQAGDYQISFRVSDNGVPQLSDTKEVQITVLDLRDLSKESTPLTIFGSAGPVPQSAGDEGDSLGASMATGDLNGDGIHDLAVGAPAANGRGVNNGQVYVFFGSRSLEGTFDLARQTAHVTLIGEAAEDRFGASLVIADLSGDGKNDLIIGAPSANAGNLPRAGKVYSVSGNLLPGIVEIEKVANVTILGEHPNDHFGTSLAAGFLRNGPAVDLFVGAPGADISKVTFPVFEFDLNPDLMPDAGKVYGFFGGSSLQKTIPAAGGSNIILDGSSADARLGATLAVGNFNGDSFVDLAIGAPNYTQGIGAVHLVPGGENFDGTGSITLLGTGIGDNFGAALQVGDINADGKSDLIIGAPGGDGPGDARPNAGEVYVIYGGVNEQGRPADLTLFGAGNIGDEYTDAFGASLAFGDFTGDGISDLAVGAPGVDGTDPRRKPSGAVFLIFGGRAGLSGVREISVNTADVTVYGADSGDSLGAGVMAIADVNGSEANDLILGIPLASSFNNSRAAAGEVRALWGYKR